MRKMAEKAACIRIVVGIVFAALSFVLFVPFTVQAQDPEGFRGMKWGTNLSEAAGMVVKEESEQSKYCVRSGDKMSIGGAKLTNLAYVFYKDRFCTVLITTKGLSDWLLLRDAVFAQYKEGIKPNRFMDKWFWGPNWGNGVPDVEMSLSYITVTKESTLYISFSPIKKERDADREQRAKDAKKDF